MIKPRLRRIVLLAAVCATAGEVRHVDAQVYGVTPEQGPLQRQPPTGPLGRPTYSPYLNLLRPGDPAINYYGLVRPEFEFRQSDLRLRQELSQLELLGRIPPSAARQALDARTTGHAAGFMTNLQGGPASTAQEARQRAALQQALPPRPGGHLPPTGHSAWFGNAGGYFPQPR